MTENFLNDIEGHCDVRKFIQETRYEMRIPERDVTYIVLSVYLLALIDRQSLTQSY